VNLRDATDADVEFIAWVMETGCPGTELLLQPLE